MNQSMPEKRTSRRVETQSEYRKRKIHRTREGISKLKAAKTLSLDDSLCMAKNLGSIARRTEKKTGVSIRKVFISALGEALGESLYKKRKTVMLFEGERSSEREIRRSPQAYINLAEQLFKEVRENSSDEVEVAALGELIERTSFESKQRPAERMHQDAFFELEQQLDSLVRKLEDKVDLDWMCAFVSANKIGVDSKYCGRADAITLGNEAPQSSYHVEHQSLSFDSVLSDYHRHNNIAPCVRIAKYYVESDLVFQGWVVDNIDLLDVSQSRADQIRQRLAQLTCNDDFLVKAGLEEYSIASCQSILESALGPASNQPCPYWFDTAIDLEILYDQEQFRWIPVFLWRDSRLSKADEEDPELAATKTLSPVTFSLPNGLEKNSAPPLLRLYEYVDIESKEASDIHAVMHQCTDFDPETSQFRKASYFVMEPEDYSEISHLCPFYDWPGDKGLKFGDAQAFRLSDPDSSRVLLSQGSETLVSALDLGVSSHGYTPAPYNSLANFILSNLAYASEEHRVDRMLIRDAQKKFRMLASKADGAGKDFRAGLERLSQDEIA